MSDLRREPLAPKTLQHWRSLDEFAATAEFQDAVDREFPQAASEWDDPTSRRNFLKLMGASLALAGLATSGIGCKPRDDTKIVPYVQQPEQVVLGRPLFYATSFQMGGFGTGVIVEQHEGRPTKLEGNPDHPASLGATDIFAQASILSLYDPDRSQTVTRDGDVSGWGTFVAAVRDFFEFEMVVTGGGAPVKQRRAAPPRVRLLTDTITSPTAAAQIRDLLEAIPGSRWHSFDPVGRENGRAGAQLAFGEDVSPIYHFDKADVVLSLDGNFLFDEPGSLRYAREFIDRRRVRQASLAMANRLYVLESTPTITGAMADHARRVPPAEVAAFARRLHAAIVREVGNPGAPATLPAPAVGTADTFFDAIVGDLTRRRGRVLVVVGEYQPAEVHLLGHAINSALGNIGETVRFIPRVEANPSEPAASLQDLADDLRAGRVDALFVLGGNPAYAAPADVDFAAALKGFSMATVGAGSGAVPRNLSVHLGLHADESGRLCQWHVPEAHYLEAWSDTCAFDGTASIVQPLIAPLYQGRSIHEVLSAVRDVAATRLEGTATVSVAGRAETDGRELVRATWRAWFFSERGVDFEAFWEKSLRDGIVANTAAAPRDVTFKGDAAIASTRPAEAPADPKTHTLIFRPDPSLWDGQFANNPWLQELPKQLTKVTWGNAALVSPKTAADLKLRPDDAPDPSEANTKVFRLEIAGRELRVPVWILPGQPDACITLHLGHGRTSAGSVGNGVGQNAYALRRSGAPWHAAGATLAATDDTYRVAVTQEHQVISSEENDARELVRVMTIAGLRAGREDAARQGKAAGEHRKIQLPVLPDDPTMSQDTSLYPDQPDHIGGHVADYPAWGMVIDQTACIGCNACVVACQAENNIPVVGYAEVIRQREMHWLRIDTYFEGAPESPERTLFQPVPCMHCEKAPCELVCPVGATTHSKDGLNEMTYNRCVGTRYCSNNCPYKVRRFNFLQYSDTTTPVSMMARNPQVTVRNRGVMEKCTYCVQRISRGRIEAKKVEVRVAEATTDAERQSIREQARAILASVETACAQACPTRAITFGNMADPETVVSKLKRETATHYALLEELQTKPRTTYLARVYNPNEGIAPATNGNKSG